MSDIRDVKAALAHRAQEISAMLLPGGRKEGRHWTAGSISGEPGQSLKVVLDGAQQGQWADFANDEHHGDLLDLWRFTRGLTLAEALEQAREHLGMQPPQRLNPGKTYRRPPKPKCSAPKSAVQAYLIGERRISEEAIAAYRVGEDGRNIIYPALRDGELVHYKTKGIDKDAKGKRPSRISAECEPCLIGWQAIPPDARTVTICEGEEDALTLWDYGWPALSVPLGGGGGNKQAWIEHDFEHLARFETIYVCMDTDEVGQAAAEEISERLGRDRCRLVTLPRKDANECAVDGLEKAEIDACFHKAKTSDPDELKNAGNFLQQAWDVVFNRGDEQSGYPMPWDKVGDRFWFRPGEMTVWQGATGAGKSQALGYVMADQCRRGARVCIASFEMHPRRSLARMLRQIAGTRQPSVPFQQQIGQWISDKLWFYDRVGAATVEETLSLFEYARKRYGVDVFVIDSLMRLKGLGPEEYKAQAHAVQEIVSFVNDHNCHLHLVCHSRKDVDDAPGTDDVKGAGELTFNAANVIGVWKHQKQVQLVMDLVEKAKYDATLDIKLDEARRVPTTFLNVTKQRNGDWEGKIALHFDPVTYTYRGSYGDKIESIVPFVRSDVGSHQETEEDING